MNYILIDKKPIPCADEDLWKAWCQNNEKVLLMEHLGYYCFKIEFMPRPMEFPNCQTFKFFKVMVCANNLVSFISFHATWEKAETRFNQLRQKYQRTIH